MKKKKTNKNAIRNHLVKHVRENFGDNCAFYLGLVDDYLYCEELKEKLQADIDENGSTIYWKNGANQEGRRKNDSIAEMHKTTLTMIKILNQLGLRPKVDGGKDENCDLL